MLTIEQIEKREETEMNFRADEKLKGWRQRAQEAEEKLALLTMVSEDIIALWPKMSLKMAPKMTKLIEDLKEVSGS